jgi:hypothetical protein
MPTESIALRTRRVAYRAIITTVIVAVIIMIWTTDTEIDEAVAGVGAAFIGVAGTSLGHAVGLHRERSKRQGEADAVDSEIPLSRHRYAAVALKIMVLVLVFPGLALFFEDMPRVSAEAAAALIGALVGIRATDVAHKKSLNRSDQWWLGHFLLGCGLLGGVLLVTFPYQADVFAAIATTAIPVGGAVVGFAHGRKTAKSLSGNAALPATKNGD